MFVSFETLRKPKIVDVFVPAWSLEKRKWQSEIVGKLEDEPSQSTTAS